MHISIIANGFQEDYMTNLLNNFSDESTIIDFVCSSSHLDRKINNSIRVYNLRESHDTKTPFYKKILRILRYHFRLTLYALQTKANVFHIQSVRFQIIEGVLFSLFFKIIGKKLIYTVHDALPHLHDNSFLRLKFWAIYHLHHRLIVHSLHIKNRIINEFGIHPSKIFFAPHGVYQRPEDPLLTKEIAKEKLGLVNTSTTVLFFGIISEYKGFDVLLESLKCIENRNEFQILVAGKVATEYQTKFEQLLASMDANKIVTFLRYIEDDEVIYFFRAADVVVLPYKDASQSGVLFMSYAYGLPVIASAVGAFPENIIVGETGYLFEPNNAESLASSLIKFKTEWSPNEKERTIKAYAMDNYSWVKTCAAIEKAYCD